MFLAMNRFRIKPGSEAAFIEHWQKRESYLAEVQIGRASCRERV